MLNSVLNTYYRISETGWMDRNVFADWFELFCGLQRIVHCDCFMMDIIDQYFI